MTALVIYRMIHFVGVFAALVAVGAAIIHTGNGGGKNHPARRLLAITHGVGLLLALVGGFGMLARMGIHFPFPGWVFGKLVIWLCIGAGLPLAYRLKSARNLLWLGLFALALIAAWLAGAKPF